MNEQLEQFLDELRRSIASNSFVSVSLGNYKGSDSALQKLSMRPVAHRKGPRMLIHFRRRKGDLFETLVIEDAIAAIANHLENVFRSGHLFTTSHDVQLTIGKRSAHIKRSRPTFESVGPLEHDREKRRLVDPNAFWLKALGIAGENGKILADQQSKWKQINKFVEILRSLVESSGLEDRGGLRIVDMGSGKGYLTFAAYDLFPDSKITGVESRTELVDLCNQVAKAGGYDGLDFVKANIAEFDPGPLDILIALHACDTATDDALHRGVSGFASVIIAAPCCHHEVKKQLISPERLSGILKHPVMHERMAEMLTDGIRGLVLEYHGYRTKIFEFVDTEHTPKNNMLTAVKAGEINPAKRLEIESIMETFGITQQRLFDDIPEPEDSPRVAERKP